jgi:hypothetical protein
MRTTPYIIKHKSLLDPFALSQDVQTCKIYIMKRPTMRLIFTFLSFLVIAISPSHAQDITEKLNGATVYYKSNLHIWNDYFRSDGVYIRTAYSVNGHKATLTGTWNIQTIKGRKNICYVLDESKSGRCNWYFRRGQGYYRADPSLPSGLLMESITF